MAYKKSCARGELNSLTLQYDELNECIDLIYKMKFYL